MQLAVRSSESGPDEDYVALNAEGLRARNPSKDPAAVSEDSADVKLSLLVDEGASSTNGAIASPDPAPAPAAPKSGLRDSAVRPPEVVFHAGGDAREETKPRGVRPVFLVSNCSDSF
jgi:hypothetical protein